ncbi:hypothetical protein MPSI1_000821 [Malassezia psittaci]|uniref:NADH:flavin oxidoreductase/NADH oxidase N-terminal domain-containing protein n=1 Tax=Malassezia psittaci TaxID=1821823 RepID=A0AAF0F7R1_9BASI|nr:hypothetical protein MPSI1_000821 [Malassezia psittaci]
MSQQLPRMLQISPRYYGPVVPKNQPTVGTLPDSRLPAGTQRPLLLTELEIPMGDKTFKLKNRASVPPMCMYSSVDGFPTPFHIAHHGQFALHGIGSALVEATAVEPQGRISPQDMGIWKDEHIAAHASLVETVKAIGPGMYFGIQLAHAGRKASTPAPWNTATSKLPYVEEKDGGWPHDVRGPMDQPYADGHAAPHALTIDQIHQIEEAFVKAAERSYAAGYDFVEVHSAHGYLLASFNSPLSNKRTDEYGGNFENRTRLLLNIVRRIRNKFPSKGLWVRINGTDAVEHTNEESWTIESTKRIAVQLEDAGVDVLDHSAGGTVRYNRFEHVPGYQLPYASAVKSLGLKRMKVSTVGVLHVGTASEPERIGSLAEKILQDNEADIISVGRGTLNDPKWLSTACTNLVGKAPVGALQYDYAILSIDRYKYPKENEGKGYVSDIIPGPSTD